MDTIITAMVKAVFVSQSYHEQKTDNIKNRAMSIKFVVLLDF